MLNYNSLIVFGDDKMHVENLSVNQSFTLDKNKKL